MSGRLDDLGIAGALEELPALLVVILAVSLFSVSLAHAAQSLSENDDLLELQGVSLAFARMVRGSGTLCVDGQTGVFDHHKLQNLSAEDFLAEFDPDVLGFDYSISIQCIELGTGNASFSVGVMSAGLPDSADFMSANTCASVEGNGAIGAAKVTVTVWGRAP